MSFGSTNEDIDGVPKDIDRGPPEEDRKTEAELRGQMRDIAAASEAMGKTATIQGLYEEVQTLKLMIDEMVEQQNRLVNNFMTLKKEYQQFQIQRVTELKSWLANGGSTTPEDCDGNNYKSSH